MDSNHRRREPSDLQSDAFGRSATQPYVATPLSFVSKQVINLGNLVELVIGIEPTTC